MQPSCVVINANSIISVPDKLTNPVKHALDMIRRDHLHVFGKTPLLQTLVSETADIVIRYAENDEECPARPEAFSFRFVENKGKWSFHIIGYDDLGIIYGLLYYSEKYLGVDPFWFWADIPILQKNDIPIPTVSYDSEEKKVKYRGWFVNDEVCLIGWKEEYPPTKEVWVPVFEALLRCGGNMVIPGTDLPKHGIHAELASEMGLWVTHHHAEPLGAEMFLRAYPNKTPSYQDHPELFEALWEEAIQKQKDDKIVWVLSFRGQGDAPFWLYDPQFDTPEKRGDMISKVVRRQYEMVCQAVEEPVCCMALYGEIAELYKSGHIDVPDEIIKIWADNGYGKMVSRRQGNEKGRIPALPTEKDFGEHGIYYHITFHDLQASNHLTMFPSSPELIKEEVEQAFRQGADSYLLLNSGNIRPHLYTLDLMKELWNNGNINVANHLHTFVNRLYSSNANEIINLYTSYFDCTIHYGVHSDDRAGEEFYHHNARRIIGHWLQGKSNVPDSKLFWATGDVPFSEQVHWFKEKCETALNSWEELLENCQELLPQLKNEDQTRFYDQFIFQVELHVSGCKGFILLCSAYSAFVQEKYPLAFVYLSKAIGAYKLGQQAFQRAEHGKWKNFYRADWLTNIESTIQSLDTARRFVRMHGDSPHFFLWYKEYIMPETEKHIYLENTHRNPLSNDELAIKLAEKLLDKED
ncbi:glycosyl hydrolase 115 family protein [Bacillus sp. REN16]|uniref:glycosyl hydrolase 115 family protein n=1 Tax=Bacillus sp. REN16 TaxID=2887296 RepID=UPI001E396532|nr:glycosyl hydrolase 115 family protein [Bacillus sp. REN16]MCC3355879.1 glycosyl hydrolase 115 family protein [Bacillus sp. REN16]